MGDKGESEYIEAQTLSLTEGDMEEMRAGGFCQYSKEKVACRYLGCKRDDISATELEKGRMTVYVRVKGA